MIDDSESQRDLLRAHALRSEDIGLAPERYVAALKYLFDRPIPDKSKGEREWYWNDDEPEFDATPIEWTLIQTLIFERCAIDLAQFSNEQVGMGLNLLSTNYIRNVIPEKVLDPSVSLELGLQMMRAMPKLWSCCMGPRLAHVDVAMHEEKEGILGYVCFIWFDEWITFGNRANVPEWRDAMWNVFDEMLSVQCREVQISALHGIGHNGRDLQRQSTIDARIAQFCLQIDSADEELLDYAEAARQGLVQ
jgi:hypothetical protein